MTHISRPTFNNHPLHNVERLIHLILIVLTLWFVIESSSVIWQAGATLLAFFLSKLTDVTFTWYMRTDMLRRLAAYNAEKEKLRIKEERKLIDIEWEADKKRFR